MSEVAALEAATATINAPDRHAAVVLSGPEIELANALTPDASPSAGGAASGGTRVSEAETGTPTMPWLSMFVVAVTIMPVGLLASVFGPTLSAIGKSYHVESASVCVTLLFCGTTCGDLIWLSVFNNRIHYSFLRRLFPDEVSAGKRMMCVGFGLLVFSNFMIFISPAIDGDSSGGGAWALFLFYVFLAGMGGGMNSLSGDSIISTWDDRIMSTALALLHSASGVGTITAPWLQRAMTGSSQLSVLESDSDTNSWRRYFLFISIWSLVLWIAMLVTRMHYPARVKPGGAVGRFISANWLRQKAAAAAAAAAATAAAAAAAAAVPLPEANALPAPLAPVPEASPIAIAVPAVDVAPSPSAASASTGPLLAPVPDAVSPRDSTTIEFSSGVVPSAALSGEKPAVASTPARVPSRILSLIFDVRYWLLGGSLFLANGSVVTIGAWQYTLVFEKGYTGGRTATLSTSLFWGGVLFSRLVGAHISSRFARTPNNTLKFLYLSCGLSSLTPLGLVFGIQRQTLDAFALFVGLSLGPMLPSIISLAAQCDLFVDPLTGSNAVPIGGLIICGQLGALTLPAIIGALQSMDGVELDFCILLVSGSALVCGAALSAFQAQYNDAMRLLEAETPRAVVLPPFVPGAAEVVVPIASRADATANANGTTSAQAHAAGEVDPVVSSSAAGLVALVGAAIRHEEMIAAGRDPPRSHSDASERSSRHSARSAHSAHSVHSDAPLLSGTASVGSIGSVASIKEQSERQHTSVPGAVH